MRREQIFQVNGRLRPIWRFFLSAAMIFLAYLAVGIVLGMSSELFGWQPERLFVWSNGLTLFALCAVFKFLTASLEAKPLGSIGLALHERWRTELGIGVALGAGMMLTIAAIEWTLGLARFSLSAATPAVALTSGAYYLLFLGVAATNEELTFRGYPFQRLIEAVGPVGAVAATSVAFGLVHLGNPSHTWLSTLNTALVGVPLAVAYLRTRALWLPIGIHFGWNFLQGYGLGLEVSGIQLSNTLLRAQVHGHPLLTGGSYGPEGGLLATGVIAVATVYLLFSRGIYITGEMRALAIGPPSQQPNPIAAPSLPHPSASESNMRVTSSN